MEKIIIPIDGMHCRSCEILVEERLSQISNVKRSEVNYKKAVAEIVYDKKKPDMNAIEAAINEAGYKIGSAKEKKPLFSKNISDYKDLAIAFLFLFGFYLIAKNLGLTNINLNNPPAGGSNPSSLSVVFLVGLTAGLSTCMALVGGLILGISARHSEKHPKATAMQKFRPHLFFNAGRIGGYAVLGGLLGWFGSFLQLSATPMGLLTIAVGIAMLILGMKLVGIFPRMENKSIALPKGISKLLGIKHASEYSHKGSIITGALTFFLPCGFTQAMQLYAISTGSFSRGALIMGVFALGTAPGLLGVGGLTSVVKGIFAKRFFKFAGILVIFLALFNIANGYNLTGWHLSGSGSQESGISANDPNVKLQDGVQIVNMTETSSGYSPNKFTIKKGVPVRWIINAKDPYSCASSIVVSKLGIRKNLTVGENVIEFTPSDTGTIPFSCAMGMYTGSFNVVDQNGNGAFNSSDISNVSSSSTCGSQASPSAASCPMIRRGTANN